MKPLALLVVVAAIPALLASPGGAVAQEKVQEKAKAPAAAASAGKRIVVRLPVAEKPSDVTEKGEANVKYTVIDDDSAHVEELRVRGTTQRIVVTPKIGPKIGNGGYEILMGDGSRDLSFGANTSRGAHGQRVWHVMSF